MVVLRDEGRQLLGRQHAARRALERDDARDREGAQARQIALRAVSFRDEQDRRLRRRLRRPRHRRMLRGARPRRRDPRRRAREDRGAARGKVPIHEPGWTSCSSATASGSRSRSRRRGRGGAEFIFICVGTPPTYAGDADLSRVWTVIDELARLDERDRPGDEEHRARRNGGEGARRARRAWARARRLRLEPRVHRRGHGPSPTSCSPTAS